MEDSHLMKNRILPIGSILLLALMTSVWAADIMGKWIAKIPIQGSQGNIGTGFGSSGIGETIFSFKANGTILAGTVTSSQGEIPISEGKINGDEISFVVIRSFGGSETKLIYEGKVGLNEILFKCKTQAGPGTGQRYEFIAKREFPRHGDIPVQKDVAPRTPLSPR